MKKLLPSATLAALLTFAVFAALPAEDAKLRISGHRFRESQYGSALDGRTFMMHENVFVTIDIEGFRTNHAGCPQLGVSFEIVEIADSRDSEKNPRPIGKDASRTVLMQKSDPVLINEQLLARTDSLPFTIHFPVAAPLHPGKKIDGRYYDAKYALRIYVRDFLSEAPETTREIVFWVGETRLKIANLRLAADDDGKYPIGNSIPLGMNVFIHGTIVGLRVGVIHSQKPDGTGAKGNEFRVSLRVEDADGNVICDQRVAENSVPTRKHFLKTAPVTFRLFAQFTHAGKTVRKNLDTARAAVKNVGLLTVTITVHDILAGTATQKSVTVEVNLD